MSYVVGVDGGGTKTLAVVARINGEIVGMGTAGPSNVSTLGISGARSAILNAFFNALRSCKVLRRDVVAACLGLAGLDSPRVLRRVRGIARYWRLAQIVRVEQDSTIALATATRLEVPGIVVIAGTGSVVMGTDGKGRIVKVGGWGYILDDEGSAFYIGLEALRAISRSFDGRLPRTRLFRYIISKLGVRNFYELLEKVYSMEFSPKVIGELALVVSRAANEGDRVAMNILSRAATELASMVITTLRRLRLREAPINYTGGVFTAGEVFLRPFKDLIRRVYPNAIIEKLKYQPVIGALYLALKQSGVEITDEVMKNVEESAIKFELKT